jgi:hypothetical protein
MKKWVNWILVPILVVVLAFSFVPAALAQSPLHGKGFSAIPMEPDALQALKARGQSVMSLDN